jgi:hypothetical protein
MAIGSMTLASLRRVISCAEGLLVRRASRLAIFDNNSKTLIHKALWHTVPAI